MSQLSTFDMFFLFKISFCPSHLIVNSKAVSHTERIPRESHEKVPASNAHQPLSEMVLFKYKYVYKGTSNGSSFIANKILNTLLKEWTNKMAISCVSIDDNKRK